MNDSPRSTTVPFANLHAQYLSIKSDIDEAIASVIAQSAFIRGPHVEQFEADFAAVHQVPHCVSCSNGTDSLYIAMKALGVGPGHEVLAPAHTWISTSSTITQAGGTVVFCDTEPDTFTIDPKQIEARITPRTVGIIPVHLYGQPADMEAIMSIARRHKLWVLEDCAQAHLARYKGQLVGTFGDAASFSFYPGKNLGAMGDAGAVITRHADLARRMAMVARHGGIKKGEHEIEGVNSRLDGLQAAVLRAKLPHLQVWTATRQRVATTYGSMLSGTLGLTLPSVAPDREHVWHLYVVQHEQRDSLARHLAACGVQTVVNYPVALPFLPAYARLKHTPIDFPVAYRHQSRVLSLPIFAEITERQMATVCDALLKFRD